MNIVGVGAAFCMGCCPNIRNGTLLPLLYGCRRLWLGTKNYSIAYYRAISNPPCFSIRQMQLCLCLIMNLIGGQGGAESSLGPWSPLPIGTTPRSVFDIKYELKELNVSSRIIAVSYTHLTLPTIYSV